MPLLIEAIKQKNYKKIQLALQLGWNLNDRDPEQLRTPLIELTFLEREAVAARLCKRFIVAGARADLKDIRGRNALHWACVKSRERLVEIFLKEWDEFDINAQDYEGNTALSLAVISSNENIVKKLITALNRYRLSVDLPNNNGETPLILASKSQSYLLCEILTKTGKASTEMRDKIRQFNAKEWESFSTKKVEVERPVTSRYNKSRKLLRIQEPEKVSRPPQSVGNIKNKRNIERIFSLYYDELSSSFRPPAIPPTKEEESDFSDVPTCYENDDYSAFSVENPATCPVTTSHTRKRFTITKAAQIPLSVNRMRRTKNSAGTEGSKQNAWAGKQEQGKLNGKRFIIPKLDVNKIVPVVKRNSCPILKRTVNIKVEMEAFRLEALTENIEQD